MTTGPVVDIPGSNYAVVELSHLKPQACCLTLAPVGAHFAFAICRAQPQRVFVQNVDGSDLKEISSLSIHDGDSPCPDPGGGQHEARGDEEENSAWLFRFVHDLLGDFTSMSHKGCRNRP